MTKWRELKERRVRDHLQHLNWPLSPQSSRKQLNNCCSCNPTACGDSSFLCRQKLRRILFKFFLFLCFVRSFFHFAVNSQQLTDDKEFTPRSNSEKKTELHILDFTIWYWKNEVFAASFEIISWEMPFNFPVFWKFKKSFFI